MNLFSIFVISGVAVFLITLLLAIGYMKAPPDKAYVVTGLRKRFLIGKAGFRIPGLERKDALTLELISIVLKTPEATPTNDFINIKTEAVANVKIGSESDHLEKAAQHFLNLQPSDIETVVRQVLEGNLREIIGQVPLRDLLTDRKAFSDRVADSAKKDFDAMGLVIISFNIQSFKDERGVIDNLGINNVAQISKDASIASANAHRDVAIAEAEAANASNKAQADSKTQIAIQNNALAIKEADLKAQADARRAMADNAYNIQMETSRRELEIQKAEANSAKIEKETEVQERQVSLTEKTLEADVKKRADAERYRIEQEAQANLARVNAESSAARFKLEQEAAGIEAKGLAEAKAIQAKAEAEAAGILKKAEAMKEMKEAAIIEMVVNQLPDIVKNAAAPLANVDQIILYGDAQGSKIVGDVMNSTTQIFEGLKNSLGFDVKSLIAGMLGGKLAAPKAETASDKN